VLVPRGMLVLYGQSSGPVPAFDPNQLAARGSLFLTRPGSTTTGARERRFLDGSRSILLDGIWRARAHGRSSASPREAAEAHRLLESRQTSGKLLLIP